MITYINALNHAKYASFFDKAKETILRKSESDQNFATTWNIDAETFDISSLNDYFANFKLLMEACDEPIDKYYYNRLPLDEETFDINANTRLIKIPQEFIRYGVGVLGDESAEIVYFKINRFFDNTDLALANIVIQWEAKNKNKETIYGLTPNFGHDLKTEPGSIIFGWPIYGEMTEAAGTIKFAVRFYTIATVDNQNILDFSLSTLPAEIVVNPTLNYELLDNSIAEVSHSDRIVNRITSTGIYSFDDPEPGRPVISVPLSASGFGLDNKVIDFDINGQRTLSICARALDIGTVFYDWKLSPYNSDTGLYETSANQMRTLTGAHIEYKLYTGETLNDTDEYYIKTANNVYKRIDVSEYFDDDVTINENENTFTSTTHNADYELFRRFSEITVEENNGEGTGIYTVNITVRARNNSITEGMEPVAGIKIPGPEKPKITSDNPSEDDDYNHVILEDNATSATITVTAERGETGLSADIVGEHPENYVSLTYNWEDRNSANPTVIDPEDSEDYYEFNADKTELTIDNLVESNLDRKYLANVTAKRNGIETTQSSKLYRITHKAAKPILLYNNNPVGEKERQVISMRGMNNLYNSLTFIIQKPDQTDLIEYCWVKMTVEDLESDWENGISEKLLVTVADEAIAELFPPIIDANAQPDTFITDLTPVSFNNEDSAIINYSLYNLDGQPGIYYCIVINTLNGNKIATTSPFFNVVLN